MSAWSMNQYGSVGVAMIVQNPFQRRKEQSTVDKTYLLL